MDVVCAIETQGGVNLEDRVCALEEIKQACYSVGANFHKIQVFLQLFKNK